MTLTAKLLDKGVLGWAQNNPAATQNTSLRGSTVRKFRISAAAVRALADAGVSLTLVLLGIPIDAFGLETYLEGRLRTIRLKGESF